MSSMNPKEAIEVLLKTPEIIGKFPKNSVYSLINFEGSRFNTEFINTLKKVGELNDPFVRAATAYGLSATATLIAKSVMKITGRKVAIINSGLEDAKEFLHKVSTGEKEW